MDNATLLDIFPTEGAIDLVQDITHMSTSVNQYILNATDLPLLEGCNSTQTNCTIAARVGRCLYLAVRILSGLLAIFGNSLIIFAVVRFERLGTCGNYLLCNLAVFDILSGLMVPLVLVHEIYSSCPFFIPICLLQQVSIIDRGPR